MGLSYNSTPASNLSKKESYIEVVYVMMAWDVTVEAIMEEMERNKSPNESYQQDHEIVTLRDQIKTHEIAESSQTLVVKANDKGKVMLQKKQHNNPSPSPPCRSNNCKM